MDAAVRSALKSQYRAALATVREAVERCPDKMWDQSGPMPPYWQTAYHTLFFAHFYLGQNLEMFEPWAGSRGHLESLDPTNEPPYTKAELIAYLEHIDALVPPTVDSLDLATLDSGFPWYKIPKLDHQLVNIRHIMDHAGQLDAQLRVAGLEALDWHH